MRAGRICFFVVLFAAACGARSSLEGLGDESSGSDAAIASDVSFQDAAVPSDASEASACTVSSAPCDAAAVATCDGCAPPTLLATCQHLPGALALDDASVVWINDGVVDSPGGHNVLPTYKDGALMRCAASGCGGTPSPIAVGIHQAWTESFAIAGASSYYSANESGWKIFRVDDSTCADTPPGVPGGGYDFAADETTLYFTTWNGNTVEACTGACASPTTLWKAPTPNIFTMGIAVDATDVYWSTSHGEIYRCAKSGCAGQPTLVMHVIVGLDSIALDDVNVYAAGWGLLSCPKSGCAQPKVLTTSVNAPTIPFAHLATDGVNVYWARILAVSPSRGGVFRCPVTGCLAPELIAATGEPGGIAVDATRVYWSDTSSGTISSLPK